MSFYYKMIKLQNLSCKKIGFIYNDEPLLLKLITMEECGENMSRFRVAQEWAAELYESKMTIDDFLAGPRSVRRIRMGEKDRDMIKRAMRYPTDDVLLSFAGRMEQEGKDWQSIEMPRILRLRIASLVEQKH